MHVQSCCFANLDLLLFLTFLLPSPSCYVRVCLHGGGGAQVGEVTRLGGLKK